MNSSPKIAVLMGGPSGEHDISLKSGRGIAEALTRLRWTVESVVIPHALTGEQAREFTRAALQRARAEVVFIALHGLFGEDGTVQALCEELHLAYTGSTVPASRLGMDKIASRRRFAQAGLPVPRWYPVDLRLQVLPQPTGFSYPLVVKPARAGSSLGVSLVQQPGELRAAIDAAGQYGPDVVVEEFVPGRELTVGVLDEAPLPVVEIRPHHAFFDFSAKYTVGLTDYDVPARLPPAVARAIQAVGLAAHRTLGCRHFSRADLILSQAGVPVVLEVNTIPGFTPTSLLPKAAACAGVSYETLCERLVRLACPPTNTVGGGAGRPQTSLARSL